jgi:HlyD family secretion protein
MKTKQMVTVTLATEVTISAEANGKLSFEYRRVVLEPNAAIGLIDTIQLYLNKEQLLAAKTTIFQNQKMYNRTNVLQEQLKTTLIEQKSSEYVY